MKTFHLDFLEKHLVRHQIVLFNLNSKRFHGASRPVHLLRYLSPGERAVEDKTPTPCRLAALDLGERLFCHHTDPAARSACVDSPVWTFQALQNTLKISKARSSRRLIMPQKFSFQTPLFSKLQSGKAHLTAKTGQDPSFSGLVRETGDLRAHLNLDKELEVILT